MNYLIGLISLVSLTVNYLIYRRITATCVLGSVETFDLEPVHDCCKAIIEHFESKNEVKVEAPLPTQVPLPSNSDVHSAWKNQKDIPWVPPVKVPEPIIQTPNRGPLARPDGFV